ncbi:MAG TPA: hypothetical protein EYP16_00815 [Candidatus Atribacteria bacterium]|nr:hypothetical protein [Candidatus Atribacteria bacterium]
MARFSICSWVLVITVFANSFTLMLQSLPSTSAALMLFNAKLSQDFAAKLLDEGIYVIGFYYPVVAKYFTQTTQSKKVKP